MTLVNPKQDRSRLSTRLLLQAAAELIAEQGWERTTLAAIGERAGYSHGLVTRRFGSKDGLLVALIDKMTTEWIEHEVKAVIGDAVGVDALRRSIDAVRTSIGRDPLVMRAFYSLVFEALMPIPVLRDRMRQFNADHVAGIEAVLRAGLAQGIVPPTVDPPLVARLVVSAMRGAAYQWLADPDFDIDGTLAALADHIEMFLECGPSRSENKR